MVTIYGSDGIAKAEIEADDNSTQAKEIQAGNTLSLSFTLYRHVAFDVNDYTDFEGERYWLMDAAQPRQKSTMEWEYNLVFYGIENLMKRFLVINDTDGDCNPVFSLTAPPREHAALVVRSINTGMGTADWKVGTVEGVENITIDYEGKYCDKALAEIAKAVGTEYWAEGQTVNVCRCEHGEEVSLGYRKGLLNLERDTADNVPFYTRLFPVGSSKNIDPEKYGHSRLQLPGGKKYADIAGLVEKYGIFHHYESSAFADIYPKRIGTVSSVRSVEATGEDGEPYKIFYFKDSGLDFDPNDYELPQKVKRVSFQEGSELAGIGQEENGTYYLEVNYHSDAKEFEIITVWPFDDDTQLPNDTLCPKTGDKYILWNIRMPDEYYALAEQEYQAAVEQYNADNALDVSRYKAATDHVYIEDNRINLFVGRRVKLESREFFPETGYRCSRITKLTRRVNLPSSVELEISDALSTGGKTSLQNDITGVRTEIKSLSKSISLPDLIKVGDNTLPTDNNLYSARRTNKEIMKRALSREHDDKAEGLISFLKGILLGEFVPGSQGGKIDPTGHAELHSLLLRTDWQSKGFAAGMTGAGVGTVNGAELHADKLLARKYIEVLSLVVSQMFWRGGRQVLSPAGLKVSRVEAVAGGWRLYMETEDGQKNEFTVGAQARCNNYGTSQRYWWRLVTAVGADYIEVSETDCDAGSVVPAVGDEVVQLGHRTDPHQQWAVMDSSFSDDAGRTIYAGIDSYDLSGKLVLREGVDPNDPGRIGLFLADGTEVSTAIGNLQDEIGGLGEGLRMDIVAEEGNLVVDGAYDGDLVATVWRRWNDITSTVSGWVWTRQSGTDSASLASDALWNEAHAGVKSGRINITGADIVTDTVKFVCDATVGTQTVRGIFYGQ